MNTSRNLIAILCSVSNILYGTLSRAVLHRRTGGRLAVIRANVHVGSSEFEDEEQTIFTLIYLYISCYFFSLTRLVLHFH